MLYSLGHHRSHGFALLVGILAFPAFAQWSGNDSYRLNQIYLQLGGDYNSSHSIHSDLAQVLSLQRGVFNVSSNTYELLDQFIDEFRDVLSPDGDGGYDAVNIDFNLDGYTPYVHRGLPYDARTSAELLVTNRAETFWLEKIYDAIMIGGGGGYTAYTPYLYSQNPATYQAVINSLMQGITDLENGVISESTFLFRYGDWLENIHDLFSHIDYLSLSSEESQKVLAVMQKFSPVSTGPLLRRLGNLYSSWAQLNENHYGTKKLYDYLENSGINSDNFTPTNFFTADGTIENTDNTFTNSSSVFNKFATSFLPSGLFDPDEVDTNLFEYVDADISPNPTFNPQPLQGGTRSRSSASFDYDFDDSDDYSYNLLNPLKTATDQVQNDTDIDNKFQTLADLVNQRISSIFDSPLNSISKQPSRWSVKFRDKDGNSLEEYVSSQQSDTSDGITFVCWVIESTMFAGFFFTCVRRSLRIGLAGDPPA